MLRIDDLKLGTILLHDSGNQRIMSFLNRLEAVKAAWIVPGF